MVIRGKWTMKVITLAAVVCLAGVAASNGSMTNEQISAALSAGAKGKARPAPHGRHTVGALGHAIDTSLPQVTPRLPG